MEVAFEETLRNLKVQQENYALPSYVASAAPASEPVAKHLRHLNEHIIELQKKCFIMVRKKKFLDYATSHNADYWVEREGTIVAKETKLQSTMQSLNQLKQQHDQLRTESADKLESLKAGHRQLVEAMQRAHDIRSQYVKCQQDCDRLVNQEQVLTRKSPAEFAEEIEKLQNEKTDLEQVVLQRTAIRDDKLESLRGLETEFDELRSTIAYLQDKAKQGRQSADERLAKRAAIKTWYEKCSLLLSESIGFSVRIENQCLSDNSTGGAIVARIGTMDVKVLLNSKDVSIESVWLSWPIPVDDIVERARKADNDFSWLLRQIHHRYVTFEARQTEIDSLVEKGFNVIYNVAQSPDTVLAVVNDAVFGFELSRKYPDAVESLKPVIKLVSAESAKQEVVDKVKSMLNSSVTSLSVILKEIS